MAADLTWPADRMAKFIDVTPRRLSQLVQEGVIERAERGRYNPFLVTVAYIRNLRSQRKPESESEVVVEARADRARRTKAEADTAEIEAADKIGLLMLKRDASIIWSDAVIEIRKLVQSQPTWDSTKLLVALSKIKPEKP